ncbi:MAG: acetyl-CoA synthase subunit gamma [Desulfuromonadales bacterium]|nr:acetyl-CoA synthase subunit gamma [Desulfuromonadales bacterium]
MARIATQTGFADTLGTWKARWGIGRMDFLVPPGLYAIGRPTPDAPVLVTANYKMSYDIVRLTLDSRNCWLLVLETYGINVWCAAGKGTFGTGELVRRVTSSGLARVVNHRRLILPLLGAPGVAAHQVKQRCGFTVSYACIRAADLPEYLDNGLATTPAMRRLTFTLYERLVLIPVELVLTLKALAVISGLVLLACGVLGGLTAGLTAFGAYIGAVLSGIVLGPLLLPWLPGRSFAVKGAVAGLVWALCYRYLTTAAGWSIAATLAALLVLPAVSAFYTLNFTGCSTYTSRSGVRKEMRLGLPVMGGAVLAGVVVLLIGRLI